jgi:hypothetical protein
MISFLLLSNAIIEKLEIFFLKGGEMAGDLLLVLGWGSPIGISIFLALLGLMIFLLAKADEISKHTKAFEKEKGIERKSALREKLGSPQK